MIDTIGWIVTINTAIICFCAWKIACLKAETLLEMCQLLRHQTGEGEEAEDGRWHD